MRYILIDARHRKVWQYETPCRVDEAIIARELRASIVYPVQMSDDVDLWVGEEPKSSGFSIPPGEPPFAGSGILLGRSRMLDVKGLPLIWNVELVRQMVRWHAALPDMKRPVRTNLPGLVPFPTTGIARSGANGANLGRVAA